MRSHARTSRSNPDCTAKHQNHTDAICARCGYVTHGLEHIIQALLGPTMPAGTIAIARQSQDSGTGQTGRSAGALRTARGLAAAAALVVLLSPKAQAACRRFGQSCHTLNDICDEGHYCAKNWGTSGQCQRTRGAGFSCDPDGTCDPGYDCQQSAELPSSPCYSHAHTGHDVNATR